MSILFAILLFSFLVFIHEFGHFIAAKLSGVQVNEFSIFMGPAIYQWERGETTYSIRLIPLGGFCAMEGENEDTDSPHSFQKASWWKRLVILMAGSAMNFVTGVLLMCIVFAPYQTFITPEIASFDEGCTLNGEEGLRVGDRFLEIDGEKIFVYSDVSTILSLNPGDIHDVVVERNGEKVHLPNFEMLKHEFPDGTGGSTLRYGFSFDTTEATFGEKLKYAWNSVANTVRTVRLSLQMLITGQAGLKDMSGPVGIVQIMSETAEASETFVDALLNLLYFGGFIAINLAVMNLLPIPALDGGRVVGLLLTSAIEAITKKKIDAKFEAYVHGAGMILLLALMAVILFKDIFVLFKG